MHRDFISRYQAQPDGDISSMNGIVRLIDWEYSRWGDPAFDLGMLFALIRRIQAKLEYREIFDNTGICMLQVAKTLLCRPEQSIPIVFGTTAPEQLGIGSW